MRAIPARPLVGAYRITEGGRVVGREEWKLFAEGRGIVVRSRIVRELPEPSLENLRLDLDDGWGYRSCVIIQQGAEGYGRTHEGAVDGHRWRVQVATAAGTIERWEFPWDASRVLAFPSPLFHGLALLRLGLAPGEGAAVRALAIAPGTYAPAEVEGWYGREEDDHLEVAAGRFHASRYRYGMPGGGAGGRLWTDLRFTVVRLDDAFELIAYGEE